MSCPRSLGAVCRLGAAALLAVSCLLAAGPAQAEARGTALFSLGPDFGAPSGEAWRRAMVTGELRSGRDAIWGLRPIYSFSLNRRGGVMVGAGLYLPGQLGAVEVTPHFSVVAWQDGRGGFEVRELVQFRSGIDLAVPVSPTTSVGLGIFHVSNAGITRRSANLDVIRLAVLWRY